MPHESGLLASLSPDEGTPRRWDSACLHLALPTLGLQGQRTAGSLKGAVAWLQSSLTTGRTGSLGPSLSSPGR